MRPLERLLYKLTGVDEDREMCWTEYSIAMLLFSGVSMVVLYLLERTQQWLPLNPQKFAAVSPELAFNTAASFTTNTNWQFYTGEQTMSYLTQMAGLAFHNFASAAVGIALAVAFIRGIARREKDTIGNFWVDMTRSTLWILLPMCLVYSLVLVSQGVIQNFKPYDTVKLVEPQQVQKIGQDGKPVLASGRKTCHGYRGPTDDRARARRVSGSHQDAGNERRRIYECQQRAPIRKSHALQQFPGDAFDLHHSCWSHVHAGTNGRVAAARMGNICRYGGLVFCRRDNCLLGGVARQSIARGS